MTKWSPTLTFGREVCGDLAVAEGREWLVTNNLVASHQTGWTGLVAWLIQEVRGSI
ncbi:MAG: hypothetical protein Kow0063_15490 [Anaerolineae bacterium]